MCTKFHENPMMFHWDNGDISIFKMAAVRHLRIVLPPYETTHEVSDDGCSCLPKIGVLGDLGPLNVIIHHRDLQKADPCVKSRFYAINCKNPLRGLACRRVDRKCDRHTHTHTEIMRYTPTHTGKFVFCPCIALDRQNVCLFHCML